MKLTRSKDGLKVSFISKMIHDVKIFRLSDTIFLTFLSTVIAGWIDMMPWFWSYLESSCQHLMCFLICIYHFVWWYQKIVMVLINKDGLSTLKIIMVILIAHLQYFNTVSTSKIGKKGLKTSLKSMIQPFKARASTVCLKYVINAKVSMYMVWLNYLFSWF